MLNPKLHVEDSWIELTKLRRYLGRYIELKTDEFACRYIGRYTPLAPSRSQIYEFVRYYEVHPPNWIAPPLFRAGVKPSRLGLEKCIPRFPLLLIYQQNQANFQSVPPPAVAQLKMCTPRGGALRGTQVPSVSGRRLFTPPIIPLTAINPTYWFLEGSLFMDP